MQDFSALKTKSHRPHSTGQGALYGFKEHLYRTWESKWNPSQSTWLCIAPHIFKEEFGCHGFIKFQATIER